ncbi:MAG TPA: SDR family NAD(P)-dependent oxidoreductase [Actinomycetota bacterium]|jgi:NAD(P)-dependent dehydrogenase (short-subunit alcohol dehydrogenase family)|nr:SDR family NAD(P)-dependent oxidoreductase [Actinomycetota bacterium]
MPERVLQGKVAIVTGGSKGIGKAIGKAFAEAGASVALAARGEDDLQRTAKEIEASGGETLAVPTDVTDQGQVQALVDRAVERFGTLDILVNNAGAAPFMSTLDQIRLEGFEKYFRVNFTSAVLCTRAVAPVMLARGEGCAVLNVASVAGFIASPGLSYYASAKAALISLTRTVAQEWAPYRVRVNALAPGWVQTDMNEPARQMIPEFNRRVLESIPLGRWGTADDVAGAALFLCSPAASFITGSVLIVDGGQTLSTLTGL